MAAIDHAGLAEELRAAERNRRGVRLLTDRFPGFDWDDARAVARARDDLRLADGDELVGYKLGWTSSAMREALGIERPNWGTLWRSQTVESPARLIPADLIHPKIEPELVHVVGPADDSTDRWALGLEVVDPRYPSFDFRWLDNTADNSSSARVVVGRYAGLESGRDPAEVAIEFEHGGEVRDGVGADAMGSPRAAVSWLRAELTNEGAELLPGQIVFTGGLARPFDLAPGSFTVRALGFDPVELMID